MVSVNVVVLFLLATKLKGVDLDAPGNINGVPVLEVEMESFEEKPWRKPGQSVCLCVADKMSNSLFKHVQCFTSFVCFV